MAPKGGPGGIRASDLQAPSPNCLVVHPLHLPKIQNPQNPQSKIQNPQNPKSLNPKSKIPQIQNPKSSKSKIPQIQNPKSPNFGFCGFWILDFGSLCSNFLCEAPNAPNLGFWGFWGFWILDFGFWEFWILDFGDFGFGDFGFWIVDFGDFGFWEFWILILGFWILDCYVANIFVRPPTPQILDFGGDFGFWILELLGILDFGFWEFWILDFGDLDFGLWDKFWILVLHKQKIVYADPGRRIIIYFFIIHIFFKKYKKI